MHRKVEPDASAFRLICRRDQESLTNSTRVSRSGGCSATTTTIAVRLRDSTCLLLSDRQRGPKGGYREPHLELRFKSFVASMLGRAIAFVRITVMIANSWSWRDTIDDGVGVWMWPSILMEFVPDLF